MFASIVAKAHQPFDCLHCNKQVRIVCPRFYIMNLILFTEIDKPAYSKSSINYADKKTAILLSKKKNNSCRASPVDFGIENITFLENTFAS